MKCKNRKELNNRLRNVKYLKIALNMLNPETDKDEILKIKREIKKVEKVIDIVITKYSVTAGNILKNYYINDLSLQEITGMYNLSYETIKHSKAAAITYILENKLL